MSIRGATGQVSWESIEKAVKSSVPKGTEELNLKALKKGYDYGKEQAAKL